MLSEFTIPRLIGATLSVLAFGSLFALIFWRWSRSSSDVPGVLGIKLVVTVVLGAGGIWAGASLHPFIGVPVAAIAGIFIGILWGRNIGLAIASPLASLYDGGDEAVEPQPFYAIAEAHRKQGRFTDAIAAIQGQLEKFPGDPGGLLMLAEIRARHLSDWTGAAAEIEQILGNEKLAVPTKAKALQALADWHLDFIQDTAGAAALFQRVIDLFPGTPEAREAAQRLAHTGDGAWRREQRAPSLLKVQHSDEYLGLRGEAPAPAPEVDPELLANALRDQLAAHPLDTEAREKLAMLYADAMGRPDFARGEMEKLLAQPNHPPKSVARWLHQLADLEIRHAADETAARAALQRVIELFPGSALAANAQSRLERLKLEVRGTRKASTLRSGSSGFGLDSPG